MKAFVFLFSTIVFLTSIAQAETVERFAGKYTIYRKRWDPLWDVPIVHKCVAAVKTTDKGYEVAMSYGAEDLAFVEGQTFVFAKEKIEHPATNRSYDNVPVNFPENQYFAYARIPKLGSLRMALVKVNNVFQVDTDTGFMFAKADSNSYENAHCMGLRRLNRNF